MDRIVKGDKGERLSFLSILLVWFFFYLYCMEVINECWIFVLFIYGERKVGENLEEGVWGEGGIVGNDKRVVDG